MNQQSSFFAVAFRQKYINRWGLMQNVKNENLAEHASEVAMIAHALAVIGNTYFQKSYDEGKTALLGLYHDVPEVYTGDLPTPIKYYSKNTKESYALIEEHAVASLLSKLPAPMLPVYHELLSQEDSKERFLVKCADKLCAYIKCVEEEKFGNSEFKNAKETLYQGLLSMESEELRWFMDHILPSFSLSLDEMQM